MIRPTRTEKQLPDGKWLVTVTPPAFLKMPSTSTVLTAEQMVGYRQWISTNAPIQSIAVLAALTDDQREILISGIAPSEFDRISSEFDQIFGEEE